MLTYILKRLLLMVPTLLGVMTVTFVVIQFVPGGPVEQIMAEARATAKGGDTSGYRASRDIDQRQIEELKKLYGFDKPPLEDLPPLTFPIDPKLKNKVLAEVQATVSQLPLEVNDAVLSFINYFSTERGRRILLAGGDLIVAVDGHPVLQYDDLISYIVTHKAAGDTMVLTVIRNGQKQDVTMTLGKRPA